MNPTQLRDHRNGLIKALIIAIIGLGFSTLAGCASGLKTTASTNEMMSDTTQGVCAIGYQQPFRATKGDCFAKDGLFEQTDNPDMVIANYVPSKRPPKPPVAPVIQTPQAVAEPAKPPSKAKQQIEAAEARGDEKAPCYLKGSDKPFMMAKSICTSSGGKLTP